MKDPDGSEYITEPDEIYRILRSLELSRSLLTLRFHDHRHDYSSLILDTDLNQGEFIIDELNSFEGNQRLVERQAFTIIAHYQGVQVSFKNNHANSQSPKGFTHAYSIAFPTAIRHTQRRDAYRFHIPLSLPGDAQLPAQMQRQPLQADRITDLSSSGIGLEFDHYIRPEIEKGEHFNGCTIRIGSLQLEVNLKATHLFFQKATGHHFCGFEFVRLDKLQQKAVDRALLQWQRDARRMAHY